MVEGFWNKFDFGVGMKTPTKTKRFNFTDEQKALMKSLYEIQELAWDDIKKVFGCSSRTIEYHLHKMGVQIRPRGMTTRLQRDKVTGVNSWNWKGGKSRDKHGYVIVTEYDHPIRGCGHIPEHRIIMENHLLRTDPNHPALLNGMLRKDWVVHHKNGIKPDNRIENLEPLPRHKHHSWMHFRDEMQQMKVRIAELELLVDELRTQSVYAV